MLRIYNPPTGTDAKLIDITPLSKKLTAEEEKKIADMFKATDKDGDMKVGKQELVDKVIEEYKNTGKLPDGYDNLGDYIADQMKNFGEYDKNKDGKLNIDEYTEMSTAPKLKFALSDELKKWLEDNNGWFKPYYPGKEHPVGNLPVMLKPSVPRVYDQQDPIKILPYYPPTTEEGRLAERPKILPYYPPTTEEGKLAERPIYLTDDTIAIEPAKIKEYFDQVKLY